MHVVDKLAKWLDEHGIPQTELGSLVSILKAEVKSAVRRMVGKQSRQIRELKARLDELDELRI